MQQDQDQFDPHEGSAEDVGSKPLRRPKTALSLAEVLAPPGEGKFLPSGVPDAQNLEFITYRGPQGLIQLSLSHFPVFRTLWNLWSQRRGSAEEAGATAYEVAEALGERRERIAHILASLTKSGVVRQIARSTGYRGVRTKYYPSDFGVKLFALAEEFGYGVQIQIGRTVRAWRTRSQGEPIGIFERAKLLTGRTV